MKVHASVITKSQTQEPLAVPKAHSHNLSELSARSRHWLGWLLLRLLLVSRQLPDVHISSRDHSQICKDSLILRFWGENFSIRTLEASVWSLGGCSPAGESDCQGTMKLLGTSAVGEEARRGWKS